MLNKVSVKTLTVSGKIFSGAPLYSVAKLKRCKQGVPVLNIKNIADNRVYVDGLKLFSLEGFKNAEHYIVCPDDVLITCRGTQLKTAIVPDNIKKALITSNLIAIRLNKEKVLPEFLIAYFNTRAGERVLLEKGVSTTSLILNVRNISEVKIPVPPLPLQKEIINLANIADEQYHLSIEIANIRKKLANQIITNMFSE